MLNGLKVAEGESDKQLRPMDRTDWMAFAGAEPFEDGSEPLIAYVDVTEWPPEYRDSGSHPPVEGVTVIADKNGVAVSGENAAFAYFGADKEQAIEIGNKIVQSAPVNYQDLVRQGFEAINFPNDDEINRGPVMNQRHEIDVDEMARQTQQEEDLNESELNESESGRIPQNASAKKTAAMPVDEEAVVRGWEGSSPIAVPRGANPEDPKTPSLMFVDTWERASDHTPEQLAKIFTPKGRYEFYDGQGHGGGAPYVFMGEGSLAKGEKLVDYFETKHEQWEESGIEIESSTKTAGPMDVESPESSFVDADQKMHPFEKIDWNGWAGAESFDDETPPYIAYAKAVNWPEIDEYNFEDENPIEDVAVIVDKNRVSINGANGAFQIDMGSKETNLSQANQMLLHQPIDAGKLVDDGWEEINIFPMEEQRKRREENRGREQQRKNKKPDVQETDPAEQRELESGRKPMNASAISKQAFELSFEGTGEMKEFLNNLRGIRKSIEPNLPGLKSWRDFLSSPSWLQGSESIYYDGPEEISSQLIPIFDAVIGDEEYVVGLCDDVIKSIEAVIPAQGE